MKIDNVLLNELSAQAKANPRLRQHKDLRNTEEDNSQRMLNALEPGTKMSIHRHPNTSTTVVILRGSIMLRFYDKQGNLDESVSLDADGDVRAVQVEKGRWHNLECLEVGTVIIEAKDGKWEPYEIKNQ